MKKALSLFIVLVLALGMIPLVVFAKTETANGVTAELTFTSAVSTPGSTASPGNTATPGATGTVTVTLSGTATEKGTFTLKVAPGGSSTVQFTSISKSIVVEKDATSFSGNPYSATFTKPTNDVADSDFVLTFTFAEDTSGDSGGGTGGGGSSGGGSGGGSSSKSRPAASKQDGSPTGSSQSANNSGNAGNTSSNVTGNGAVSHGAVKTELQSALENTSAGETAKVTVKNAQSISSDTLKTLAADARQAGKNVVLNADTTDANGNIQGRLYVEPAKLTGLSSDLKLGVYTDPTKTAATKNTFEKFFDNDVSVVNCEQKGSFGASLKMAVKVDLSKLDTSSLVFYSHDPETNKFSLISDANYFIDKNGYLHFTTEKGNNIIITDKPLTKK